MKRIHLIPRLDIKGPNLIKGIQAEVFLFSSSVYVEALYDLHRFK